MQAKPGNSMTRLGYKAHFLVAFPDVDAPVSVSSFYFIRKSHLMHVGLVTVDFRIVDGVVELFIEISVRRLPSAWATSMQHFIEHACTCGNEA